MADFNLGKRALLIAALALTALQLAGCNTLAGAGKDIQKIGEVVQDGAQAVGDAASDAVN
ncbi:MAG TPA: entericidin [Dongiaceae bacterium]|nr:entericidin [Dongiaceae bacterium]